MSPKSQARTGCLASATPRAVAESPHPASPRTGCSPAAAVPARPGDSGNTPRWVAQRIGSHVDVKAVRLIGTRPGATVPSCQVCRVLAPFACTVNTTQPPYRGRPTDARDRREHLVGRRGRSRNQARGSQPRGAMARACSTRTYTTDTDESTELSAPPSRPRTPGASDARSVRQRVIRLSRVRIRMSVAATPPCLGRHSSAKMDAEPGISPSTRYTGPNGCAPSSIDWSRTYKQAGTQALRARTSSVAKWQPQAISNARRHSASIGRARQPSDTDVTSFSSDECRVLLHVRRRHQPAQRQGDA